MYILTSAHIMKFSAQRLLKPIIIQCFFVSLRNMLNLVHLLSCLYRRPFYVLVYCCIVNLSILDNLRHFWSVEIKPMSQIDWPFLRWTINFKVYKARTSNVKILGLPVTKKTIMWKYSHRHDKYRRDKGLQGYLVPSIWHPHTTLVKSKHLLHPFRSIYRYPSTTREIMYVQLEMEWRIWKEIWNKLLVLT